MSQEVAAKEEVIRRILDDVVRRSDIVETARGGMDPLSLITRRTVILPVFFGAVIGMVLRNWANTSQGMSALCAMAGASFVAGLMGYVRAEAAHRRIDALVRILDRSGIVRTFMEDGATKHETRTS